MRKVDCGGGPLVAPVLGVSAKDLAIQAGTLIDGNGGQPAHKVTILVHDDRITGIQPGFVSPAGAEVIDLSSATLMPGFIDCHIHVTAQLPSKTNATEYWVTHNKIDFAFDGAVLYAPDAAAGLHRRPRCRRRR